MMVSWLAIALVFFAVTAALAVGPLIVWRLFLGTEADERGARPRFPIFSFLLVVGAGLFAATFFWATLRSPSRPTPAQPAQVATTVDKTDLTTPTERSLFENHTVREEARAPATPRSLPMRAISIWGVLLPLLVILGLVALANGSRNGLFRAVPVTLAVVLVGLVFVNIRWARQVEVENHLRQAAEMRVEDEMAHRRRHQRRNPMPPLPASHEIVGGSEEHQPSSTPLFVPRSSETAAETANNDDTSTDVADSSTVAKSDEASKPADDPPPVTEYVGTKLFGVPRNVLPEWTSADNQDGAMLVLKSGKHATVEGAERDVLDQMRGVLKGELVKEHPAARSWNPPDDVLLASGSLQRRAVERSQIQVGEFVSPMYEAYWEIDVDADATLFQAWRPTEVKSRLVMLGAGVGLLTLLFGSLAAVLRVDEKTGGKRRKILATGTVAVWAAIGSALVAAAVTVA